MATKYWRLTLKGERSMDEIQSAIGGSGGVLVRVHFEGGETQVYFAAAKSVTANVSKAISGAEPPTEVRADEVTQLG
jgi:hypothetical protein